MRTPEEILFDKMQTDEDGKIEPLTDQQVIQAMHEYSIEVLTAYIQQNCRSRFEAEMAARIFMEKEPF